MSPRPSADPMLVPRRSLSTPVGLLCPPHRFMWGDKNVLARNVLVMDVSDGMSGVFLISANGCAVVGRSMIAAAA